jgi:hypothetical protein
MEDDFYTAGSNTAMPQPGPPSSRIWQLLLSAPPPIFTTMLLAPFLLVLMTRILSGRASEKVNGKNERTVSMLPYWFPIVGHGFSL